MQLLETISSRAWVTITRSGFGTKFQWGECYCNKLAIAGIFPATKNPHYYMWMDHYKSYRRWKGGHTYVSPPSLGGVRPPFGEVRTYI